MKTIIILLSMTFSSISFGASCSTNQGYLNQGWGVSYAKDFDQLYLKLKSELDAGIKAGDIVKDLDGIIYTDQTVSTNRIYMRTQSWDSLKTATDEMYGDIAIFTNKQAPEEVLELRWYKNGKRFVAINPQYLACVSIGAPLAVNAIF